MDDANDQKEVRKERQANYRAEYSVVESAWRFFTGLRFAGAAFTMTLQSALVALYNQVAKDALAKGQSNSSAVFVAVAGICTITAMLLIEGRTLQLLAESVRRGKEIEFGLGAMDGFFHRISESRFARPRGLQAIATHAFGLLLIYGSIFLLWLYLECKTLNLIG